MPASLSEKTALVIGAGELGAPVLLALAAAGVGRLLVADGEALDLAGLGGQPLLADADLGQRRATAAAARLARLFPAVAVEALDRPLDPGEAPELVARADVAVDGSNDLATQLCASDAAVAAGRPLVHGGVLRTTAQLLSVVPGRTSCLRCLFEAPPPPGTAPRSAEAGVLGPLAGFAGGLMAAEAVRLLEGAPPCYAGRVLVYEATTARARTVPVRPRPGCPACGGRG